MNNPDFENEQAEIWRDIQKAEQPVVEQKPPLSEEQAQAKESFLNWFYWKDRPRNYHIISGFAGCGKSHLLSHLNNDPELKGLQIGWVAPTGQAANVLNMRGAPARTIHSTIYIPEEDETFSTRFRRRYSLPYDLIVGDEWSMVNEDVWNDLRSYGIPILGVGDGFQLPPIGEDPYLLENADSHLTEVHRQAEKSPIIQLATAIRNRQFIFGRAYRGELGSVNWGNYRDFKELVGNVDVLICGFNKTRVLMNDLWRKKIGFTFTLEVGDKLVCLKNAKNTLFNGLGATVTKVHRVLDEWLIFDAKDDLGREFCKLKCPRETMETGVLPDFQKSPWLRDQRNSFWSYSYCRTCHKMQGGQADRVGVLLEVGRDWDADRWAYTAATRCITDLHFCR